MHADLTPATHTLTKSFNETNEKSEQSERSENFGKRSDAHYILEEEKKTQTNSHTYAQKTERKSKRKREPIK